MDWKAEKKDHRPLAQLPRLQRQAAAHQRRRAALPAPHDRPSSRTTQPGNRDKPGSRLAIVFNGSPLFTGGAGSGESEIRRWIIENDWLEAIVALPEQMFYNTGIGTFVWVVTNRKEKHRKGKIQLIDARDRWTPMKRSLGDKRRYLDQAAIDDVTREHGALEDSEDQQASSTTPTSATAASPSCVRCACASRSPRRPRNASSTPAPSCSTPCRPSKRCSAANRCWTGTTSGTRCSRSSRRLPDDVEGWAKGAKGTAQKKIFRDCFTAVDPEAEPVIAKQHKVEPLDRERCSPARPCPPTSRG